MLSKPKIEFHLFHANRSLLMFNDLLSQGTIETNTQYYLSSCTGVYQGEQQSREALSARTR